MQDKTCNDSMSILAQALEEMKQEMGENFSAKTVNLAELQRRTGMSRKKLRNLQKHDFKEHVHALWTESLMMHPYLLLKVTATEDSILKPLNLKQGQQLLAQ